MYCTNQDVENYYLGKSFSCGDYVTAAEIQTFIVQEAAYIDARIKTRYSLPISESNDLLILKMINEMLVVGTVDNIFREVLEEGKFDRRRNYRKEAMNMIDAIVKGDLILDGSANNSVLKFNNIDSQGNEVEKRFKDSNIEPTFNVRDRETSTIVRYN